MIRLPRKTVAFVCEPESFGGLLSKEEADCSETAPQASDIQAFIESEVVRDRNASTEKHSRPPQIRRVYFGRSVVIKPWYSAPYPEEYHRGSLWICECCLEYFNQREIAAKHSLRCAGRLPPGDEIYRHPVDDGKCVSVFEVNGRNSRRYCQNICLLAKMFLDHKTLYYDVDPFLFYVLVEWSTNRKDGVLNGEYAFVGYFSKEKASPLGYNLSCILTMPHHQRKGYGHLLVDFSYLLTRHSDPSVGSPEKPLSDLGLLAYVTYWKRTVKDAVRNLPFPCTPAAISRATGMTVNDVLATLEHLGVSASGSLYIDDDSRPARLSARPEFLRWAPYTSLR